MTTPNDVINFAKNELGYVEGGGPDGRSGNLTRYGSWYGLDGNPWCAMFVSYVFYHCGLALPAQTDKGFAYCPSGVQWFKNMGLWTQTGSGGFFAGDVVFFDEGALNGHSHSGVAGHVGIILDTKQNSVITAEGNTSSGAGGSQANGGGAYQRERPLSVILGVGRPQYAASPAGPPPPAPSAPPWPGRNLALTTPHCKGDDVRQLQAKMASWGSNLAIDGDFGKATSDGVRWWQATLGIQADGVVGPQTWHTFFSR